MLFRGISLELRSGEVAVLEGPSGCGKSTLLRAVAGLVPAGDGVQRWLDGRRYSGAELPEWRARVTLLAQDAPVLQGTVLRNLEAPYRLRAAAGRRLDRDALEHLLGLVGLGNLRLDREARSLSGGERHRLALVRGLLWNPPVLLADEPLSGLDPDTAAKCWDLLREFTKQEGRAALVVLHDTAFADGTVRRFRFTATGVEVA